MHDSEVPFSGQGAGRGKVLIAAPVHPVLTEGLAAGGYECVLQDNITQAMAPGLVKGCVGIITSTRLQLDKALIDTAPMLKWIGRMGSGMEVIDLGYAAQKRITCFASPEGNCNAVGEHALGMLLSLIRRIVWSHNEISTGTWQREENRGIELEGKTIGIIGYGHTGSSFAKKLQGFDVNILAYDKYNPGQIPHHIVNCKSLSPIFEQAEIVSFHVPLQPDTIHYLDEGFISQMRKPFILVNTSRGPVVDLAAAQKGLAEGKITGACLDVFEQEPLTAMGDDMRRIIAEMVATPNVVVTPHIAGYTHEALYKMSKTLLDKLAVMLFILLAMLPLPVWGQQNTVPVARGYPQDYFRNPLDIPIFLAGNFGECRPGHFHSGVDIKTQGVENKPVHAAADGYISRIKMEKGGFGHGLYITHPNGYTTLYAHLNDFAPAIQKYLRLKQYEIKRWDVDLQLPPSQFPVKKGQLIAYSGNTGASTAPHLHFEIRDTKTEHPLNPELFGLPIVDHIAPVPTEVAIYDLSQSIYEQSPVITPLKQKNGIYKLLKTNDTIHTDAAILGIGLNVNDYMDGSDNTIAFLTMDLYMDGKLQSEIQLDDIGYDVSRYVNAYADYKTKEQTGNWIQCLFKLPGNHLDNIYSFLNQNNGGIDATDSHVGTIDAAESYVHEIKIMITDDRNNTSKVLFYIKPSYLFVSPAIAPRAIKFSVNQRNEFNEQNVRFSLGEHDLYDNIFFQFKMIPDNKKYSDKYQLHYPYVPIHNYFYLEINPNKPIPTALQYKVVMMYSDGKEEDGRATTAIENGWYKSTVRNFGTYWLDVDTVAPVIKPLQTSGNMTKAKQITFEVKDAMTSVKTFSGYIDGKWVCFEQHGNLFFYKFDGHCPKGKHTLVFKANDENGNERSFNLKFVR